MDSKKSPEEVLAWLNRFQAEVNATLGSDSLRFTATIWRDYEPVAAQLDPWLEVSLEPVFPFLDMELAWNGNGCLSFSDFRKPNQDIKILNLGTHIQQLMLKQSIMGLLLYYHCLLL